MSGGGFFAQEGLQQFSKLFYRRRLHGTTSPSPLNKIVARNGTVSNLTKKTYLDTLTFMRSLRLSSVTLTPYCTVRARGAAVARS